MTALLDGTLPLEAYGALVAQLQPVYAALDAAAARWRDAAELALFLDPRLTRGAAIAADLAALGVRDPEILPATEQYVARIEEVADTWPAGVIAHHYTRYLGDLSGGQAIAATLARAYGLTADHGLALYRFDGIAGPAFKKAYREHLDAMPWPDSERQAFTTEVTRAYECNMAVFAALDTMLP